MEKQHTQKCNINSNIGIPKVQKDESDCTCDGYHSFDELYEHRITLFITLCRNRHPLYAIENPKKYKIWKSVSHSDGSVGDGWFIMGIGTEKGSQITYHLPMVKWSLTDFAEQLERAPEWDGHTSDDVLTRLVGL